MSSRSRFSKSRFNQSRFDQSGFTMIEAVVAIVMSVALVVGIGSLTGRLVHHRTTTSSNSAATSLAERTMEALLALPDPANDASLSTTPSPTHGPCGTPPCRVDSGGTPTTDGPYTLQWSVSDSGLASTFFVTPTAEVKRITVTVAHANNPLVTSSVVAFYNVR